MCTCSTVPPSFLTANETPTPRIPNTMTENKNDRLCITSSCSFRFQVKSLRINVDLKYMYSGSIFLSKTITFIFIINLV